MWTKLDVTKTDTKMEKRVQKVNFVDVDEADITKCYTRSGRGKREEKICVVSLAH